MHRPTTRDADLVVRAQAGDLAAFERLVTRHRTRLLDLARQFVNDREGTQDLETLTKPYVGIRTASESEAFLSRGNANGETVS